MTTSQQVNDEVQYIKTLLDSGVQAPEVVKILAKRNQVSERTVWRRVKKARAL